MFRRSVGADLSIDDKTRLDEMTNLVDQATSDILNSVDWSANMQLVDQINATGNEIILREIVRHTRKRLQMKIPRVVMNSLTLIETLVMNCHSKFQKEVATEKFMDSMVRIVKTNSLKHDDESIDIHNKCLSIIQSWGEGFQVHHDKYPLFYDTFKLLQRQGFQFPDNENVISTPPIFTPDSKTRNSFSGHFLDENSKLMRINILNIIETSTSSATLLSEMIMEGNINSSETKDLASTIHIECLSHIRNLSQLIQVTEGSTEEEEDISEELMTKLFNCYEFVNDVVAKFETPASSSSSRVAPPSPQSGQYSTLPSVPSLPIPPSRSNKGAAEDEDLICLDSPPSKVSVNPFDIYFEESVEHAELTTQPMQPPPLRSPPIENIAKMKDDKEIDPFAQLKLW